MLIANIEATTIPDAWSQLVFALIEGFINKTAHVYVIERGSYEGSKRVEFGGVQVLIKFPQARPLEPDITHLGIPNPVERGYIEEYLPYLMTSHKEPNEQYTYGERINKYRYITLYEVETPMEKVNQVEYWCEVLQRTPHTNQAILQVGVPQDCYLSDPPCLRHIDMVIEDGKLIFYPYFRSWDLWSGFPANLGGLTYLQQEMADKIGIETGPFICYSAKLHMYKYVWELAAQVRGGLTLEAFTKMEVEKC